MTRGELVRDATANLTQAERLERAWSPFHPNDGSVLLPCNSKVRFVVRYQ